MTMARTTTDTISGPRQIRVALIGLGKLGMTVADGVLASPGIGVAAAVDLDEAKQGKDLGELVQGEPSGIEVRDSLGDGLEACDVAVLMTSSRMSSVVDTVVELVEQGINVLTSAEELAYPWWEFPEQSRRIDAAARENGVSVLSAGANPGFVMDLLPVVTSMATQQVQRLRVTRTMDVSPHRQQRLTRFGLGRSEDQFSHIPRDVAHGHIGFRQSIDSIADALRLDIDRVEEQPLRPAVVAGEVREGEYVNIQPGEVAIVSQGAVGLVSGRAVVTLEEHFGFIDPSDDIPKGDSFVLDGIDQQFRVAVEPGVRSFVTTPAVLVNFIEPLASAPAGLRMTMDFAVRDLASKGRKLDRRRI